MLDQSYLDLVDDVPAIPVRHIVSLSSGASSAVAAERVIARFGRENVDLVFADTQHEHADNYRFLNDLKKRFGGEIIRLVEGHTPEQVWDAKRLIPNDQMCPCTKALKLDEIIEHAEQRKAEGYAVVMHIGYSLKDTARPSKVAHKFPKWLVDRYPGRLLATATNWAQSGNAYVEFPCMWAPITFDVLETVKSWGIALPVMYAMGFTSANCSGDCPKGGVNHWRRVLTNFPAVYAAREAWETEKRKDPHFEPYTILTRQVAGEVVNLSLEQLRLESEGKDARQMRLFDIQDDMENVCTTSECGIGWDEPAA